MTQKLPPRYSSKCRQKSMVYQIFFLTKFVLLFSVLAKLLVTLEESRTNMPTGCCSDEEIGFLSDLLQSPELHALVKVHNSIAEKQADESFHPVLSNAVEVTEDVMELIASSNTEEIPELLDLMEILENPFLQGLLYSHDIVAQKDYLPKLPPPPPPDEVYDDDELEETIKIVQLVKSNEPLVRHRSVNFPKF